MYTGCRPATDAEAGRSLDLTTPPSPCDALAESGKRRGPAEVGRMSGLLCRAEPSSPLEAPSSGDMPPRSPANACGMRARRAGAEVGRARLFPADILSMLERPTSCAEISAKRSLRLAARTRPFVTAMQTGEALLRSASLTSGLRSC